MKRILTAVVLIPLVLLVLFKAPLWLFTLAVGVVAMGAVWEYLGLVDAYGVKAMKWLMLILTLAVFGLAIAPVVNVVLVILAIVLVVFAAAFFALIVAMKTDDLKQALPRASMSVLIFPYIVLTMLCLPYLKSEASGIFLMLFVFAVVWSGDIFAYYAGRAFGKHKLAPRISPGKTWEGTIASFIGSVFLAHLLFVDNHQIMEALNRWHLVVIPTGLPDMDNHLRLIHGVVLGSLVNVAAQLGDLVESMIKRGAGVKDSGTILPGHGGILDRIDALLFALPVVALYQLSIRVMY